MYSDTAAKPIRRLADANVIELVEVISMTLSTVLVFCFNYDTEGVGNRITNASIVCFVIVEVLACLSRRKLVLHRVFALFMLFVLFCMCSVFWSASFELSFSRVKSLLLMTGYFLALTNFSLAKSDDSGRFQDFARILVVSSLFASAYLLASSNWQMGMRVSGVIGDANQASAYLSYTVPLALYCGSKKILPKWFVFVDIVLVSLAVIVMGSRTGLMIVALGLLLYCLVLSHQHGAISFKALACLILAVLAVYFLSQFIVTNELAYSLIGKRFESIFDIMQGRSSIINENSYYERQDLMALAVQLFGQHPIAGVGIDAYAYYAASLIRNTFCHNDYLQLLSCVGVIGFSLYYSQHVYIISQFNKLRSSQFALGMALMIQLLLFHMSVVFYYQKLEFVFIAFFIALISAKGNLRSEVGNKPYANGLRKRTNLN